MQTSQIWHRTFPLTLNWVLQVRREFSVHLLSLALADFSSPPSPLILVLPPKPFHVSPMNSFRKASACRGSREASCGWEIVASLGHYSMTPTCLTWEQQSWRCKTENLYRTVRIFFYWTRWVKYVRKRWKARIQPHRVTFFLKILLHSSVCSIQAGFHQPVFMQISNLHIKTPEWSSRKTQESLYGKMGSSNKIFVAQSTACLDELTPNVSITLVNWLKHTYISKILIKIDI